MTGTCVACGRHFDLLTDIRSVQTHECEVTS